MGRSFYQRCARQVLLSACNDSPSLGSANLGIIEKPAIEGQKTYHGDLQRAMRSHIQETPDRVHPSRARPGHGGRRRRLAATSGARVADDGGIPDGATERGGGALGAREGARVRAEPARAAMGVRHIRGRARRRRARSS
ncbi:hypothetical protein BC826DRAFT_715839 [Russula brevipes]|nr:hypothetical protein BC826DRAFT_715839 [Russula brevipes]